MSANESVGATTAHVNIRVRRNVTLEVRVDYVTHHVHRVAHIRRAERSVVSHVLHVRKLNVLLTALILSATCLAVRLATGYRVISDAQSYCSAGINVPLCVEKSVQLKSTVKSVVLKKSRIRLWI